MEHSLLGSTTPQAEMSRHETEGKFAAACGKLSMDDPSESCVREKLLLLICCFRSHFLGLFRRIYGVCSRRQRQSEFWNYISLQF